MKKSRPEVPPRLPVKLGPASNGELVPRPASEAVRRVQREAMARAEDNARRLGISRRAFLESACGAATVFATLNQLGCGGGRYDLTSEAETEIEAAREALEGSELIFDVQTHHVAGDRPWWKTDEPNISHFLRRIPEADCGEPRWVDCYTRDPFIKEVFLDSDTHLGVLSALWGAPDHNPLHADEAALTRQRMAKMEGSPRLRIHGIVLPKYHSPSESEEHMKALHETWDVAAWKLYPVWGPEGVGYRLDSEVGARVIETGIALGQPLFAVHKGLPLMGMEPSYTRPLDVGPAARAHPEATFLIYHSGYEYDRREGPYDPEASRGVDALIRTVKEHELGGDGNVYAELGSTWKHVMGDPDQAAHLIGKLLAHLGEDRILWGTDCIWYGSPQDQIQAFRSFEISPEFQERFGYPALTKERKAKIFGLNAARVYGVEPEEMRRALAGDSLARARGEYVPRPSHMVYGPRTRRELLGLRRALGGLPG